jgi:hypothetical protein
MKKVQLLLVATLAALFAGCPVRSMFPLFMENDLVFNPALVGAWTDTNKTETVLFQKGVGKNYDVIVCKQKGDTTLHKVQFGRVGNSWFLDSYPGTDPSNYYLVPTHIISRAWLNGDTLRYASMEGDSLKKMIETGKLNIPHVLEEGNLVLTASTGELQKMVAQLAEEGHVFPTSITLVRVK